MLVVYYIEKSIELIMENKLSKEEEGTIAFLAWSRGDSIDDISQEMKNAFYPTLSQMPESSIRMCYRLGTILRELTKESNYNDEFLEMSDEDQMSYEKNLAKLCVKDLKLNEELIEMYTDFAYIYIGLRHEKNAPHDLQEQMKLIVAKESMLD